ncbi:MAG: hypothetical protein Homavirus6_10 [Homavirus sp.]|uniref:Uncharacterized protein n=1 Tax=Homavirus sp. TaxID=2487769 RepID=A0A3G5A9R4_9VIRU|nr:MAG: hypothetical protein Homavirus6_10 [Homavirus sp.]
MSTINTSEFVQKLLSSLEDKPPACDYCGSEAKVCSLTNLLDQLEDMAQEAPLSLVYMVEYLEDLQSRLPENTHVCIYNADTPIPEEFLGVAKETRECADMHRYSEISIEICHFFTHLIQLCCCENTLNVEFLGRLSYRYLDLFLSVR